MIALVCLYFAIGAHAFTAISDGPVKQLLNGQYCSQINVELQIPASEFDTQHLHAVDLEEDGNMANLTFTAHKPRYTHSIYFMAHVPTTDIPIYLIEPISAGAKFDAFVNGKAVPYSNLWIMSTHSFILPGSSTPFFGNISNSYQYDIPSNYIPRDTMQNLHDAIDPATVEFLQSCLRPIDPETGLCQGPQVPQASWCYLREHFKIFHDADRSQVIFEPYGDDVFVDVVVHIDICKHGVDVFPHSEL
jgi:hypothetical protein